MESIKNSIKPMQVFQCWGHQQWAGKKQVIFRHVPRRKKEFWEVTDLAGLLYKRWEWVSNYTYILSAANKIVVSKNL